MYARGMTTRDIQGHLEEIYKVEVSPTLISNVTEAVMEEVIRPVLPAGLVSSKVDAQRRVYSIDAGPLAEVDAGLPLHGRDIEARVGGGGGECHGGHPSSATWRSRSPS